MKIIVLVLLMTLTAAAEYTDLEKRNMKYLRLEGRAAKEQYTNYKATYTKLDIKLKALVKIQKVDDAKLKGYKTSHRCKGFECKHSRAQKCYKVRTQINKLRAKIRKNEPIAAKYKKDIATNTKFSNNKLKLYKSCLSKYKALVAKG
jgi:ribosomal protein S30